MQSTLLKKPRTLTKQYPCESTLHGAGFGVGVVELAGGVGVPVGTAVGTGVGTAVGTGVGTGVGVGAVTAIVTTWLLPLTLEFATDALLAETVAVQVPAAVPVAEKVVPDVCHPAGAKVHGPESAVMPTGIVEGVPGAGYEDVSAAARVQVVACPTRMDAGKSALCVSV